MIMLYVHFAGGWLQVLCLSVHLFNWRPCLRKHCCNHKIHEHDHMVITENCLQMWYLLFWLFYFWFTVERLREHWEDANSKVSFRKNQLEDMLLECRQYDELQAEFTRWASSVEEELEARKPVSNNPDILEKQRAEHKVRRKFNPLHAKFFTGNVNIYLYCMSFLHIDMAQVVEILPLVKQWLIYST